MLNVRSIPRGLPPNLRDELSMLFSQYFERFIERDEVYVDMNRINWNRDSSHEHLPLFPPQLTPERVFASEMQVASRHILMNWEDGDQSSLAEMFLSKLFSTRLFGEVYERIEAKHTPGLSRTDFEAAFKQLWFGRYSWNQMSPDTNTTCGFQHVFIGEKRRREVKGLHHWARFYILEKRARISVQSVIKKHPVLQIASMRFQLDDCLKKYGTIFFGLPIEFEILVYFCAFLIGGSRDVTFMIGGQPVTVTSYDVATRSDVLATAFFRY